MTDDLSENKTRVHFVSPLMDDDPVTLLSRIPVGEAICPFPYNIPAGHRTWRVPYRVSNFDNESPLRVLEFKRDEYFNPETFETIEAWKRVT
jgi:hypothetical protein